MTSSAPTRSELEMLDTLARDGAADRYEATREDGTIPLIRPGSLALDGKSSTEETLAREWVANHGRDWRFDHGTGSWFHWDGARWRQDRTRAALQSVREQIRAAATASEKPQLGLAKAAVAKGAETFCQIDPRIAVEHDVWDPDVFLLGTPSGVIDLGNGRTCGADRSAMITRRTAVSPRAGSPARWLQFMREVTNGDDDLAHFLHLALLLPDRLDTGARAVLRFRWRQERQERAAQYSVAHPGRLRHDCGHGHVCCQQE